jgi:hypothetical protein
MQFVQENRHAKIIQCGACHVEYLHYLLWTILYNVEQQYDEDMKIFAFITMKEM